MENTEEITVAPASLFTDSQVEIAKEALVDGCKATKTARQRSGDGAIQYVEVPDHPTRITSAKIVIEFSRGKAVATTLVANLTPGAGKDDPQEFMQRLAGDPDAIAALEDTVGKLKKAAAKVKTGKPLEITVTPSVPNGRPASS